MKVENYYLASLWINDKASQDALNIHQVTTLSGEGIEKEILALSEEIQQVQIEVEQQSKLTDGAVANIMVANTMVAKGMTRVIIFVPYQHSQGHIFVETCGSSV
ncbi:hypothetical protein Drorol1_Dr00022025 [Drosera rotundifolia]